MMVKIEKNNGSCKIQIQGEMTIYHAVDLKKKLFDNFTGYSEFALDLSEVSEMDTSGFQLLLLLKREAALFNKGFKIVSHSQAASMALEIYNMKDYFG